MDALGCIYRCTCCFRRCTFPVLGIYLWWKLFNTPKGERYLKMRHQGPFVPENEDEV